MGVDRAAGREHAGFGVVGIGDQDLIVRANGDATRLVQKSRRGGTVIVRIGPSYGRNEVARHTADAQVEVIGDVYGLIGANRESARRIELGSESETIVAREPVGAISGDGIDDIRG